MKQNTVLQEQVTEEQSLKAAKSRTEMEQLQEELLGEKRQHGEQVDTLQRQVQELRDGDLQHKEQNRSECGLGAVVWVWVWVWQLLGTLLYIL